MQDNKRLLVIMLLVAIPVIAILLMSSRKQLNTTRQGEVEPRKTAGTGTNPKEDKTIGTEPRSTAGTGTSTKDSATTGKVEEAVIDEGLAKGETMLSQLDPDQNGLYDDTERKALLDVLQQQCPVLRATYDADNDGKVTILEQTQNRHPLSVLVPKSVLKNKQKIPWAIDIFPEWIMSAYLEEDLDQGAAKAHTARGVIPSVAAQEKPELQPARKAGHGGIEFAANSGQFLSMPGQRDARWNYRWCILTFRIDANSGKDKETVLLDLNQGKSSNKSSPKIWYTKDKGLSVQYVGALKGGLDKRVLTANNVVADGKTWNVIVCGIRYGQLFASVNGTPLTSPTKQPDHFSGDWP
ncbi:MAG: hypothetical protein JXR97_06695, partial [Planctomycetes bacterium]|nr:hypothetical protein [Planctomycetota bacterium]